MSAICVIPASNAIVFAADGATYDIKTGERGGSIAKLFLLPHLNCVFGHVGVGGFGHILLYCIGDKVETFDQLVDGAFVERCRLAFNMLKREGLNPFGVRATAVLGGWSESRERYEVFKVHSSPKQAYVEGKLVDHGAWELHPITGAWVSSTPTGEAMAQLGLSNGEMPAMDYAASMIAANRLCSGADVDSDGMYGVGSFLQMALVQQSGITSWIAHRWPDPMGKPIDPECGELMPSLPIVVP